MQKIIPHLWFDTQAKEAAEFYATVFPQSKVTSVSTIHDTPSGDCDLVSFDVMGCSFMAISAGPLFKINPSISFMVNFDPSQDTDAATRIDEVWNKLIDGGTARMPIGEYPFSKRYGWVEDRYGVNWQLILTDPKGEERPLVLPSLLFVQDVCGKVQEATDFYIQTFQGKRGAIAHYPPGMPGESETNIMFTDFKLLDTWFVAMESTNSAHHFAFNEAVSFMVNCDTQEEIDGYWKALSAVPEAEQCGWLKDKYGVSWQIIPTALGELMGSGDAEKTKRVTQAFLQMKKFDIAALKNAFNG